jgi:DNA topoisomerase-1
LRSLNEPGFYRCRRSDEEPREEQDDVCSSSQLNRIEELESVSVRDVTCTTSETSGPDYFTEGALVSMMKDEGIGRPSTYGSTIERLLHRQYIRREDGSIIPTERGRDVLDFLRRAVPKICEVDFTETMEETLDEIARGNGEWSEFVEEFDSKLDDWLDEAQDLEPEGSAESRKELFEYEVCPRCGDDLYLREGQYGEFVHCADDECDFSSNPPAKTYKCPDCERHMVKQKGSKSTVYHCIAHPKCEGRRPVGEPNMTYEEFQKDAPECPDCDDTMVKRKGRYGTFWGCENYPDCDGTRQMD